MRYLAFTIICLFHYGTGMAQIIDSNIINAKNNYAFNIHEDSGEVALRICLEALSHSRQSKYLKGQGDACVTIGAVYRNTGDFQKSDSFFNAALKTRRMIGDSNRVAAVLLNLGINRCLQTVYDEAIAQLLKATTILESTPNADKILLGTTYLELSNIFDEYLEPDEALRYAQKGLQTYIKINDSELIGQAAYALGNRFHAGASLDSSLFYYNLAYNNFTTSTQDPYYISDIFTNKGIVFTEKGDYKMAAENFDQAEKLLQQLGEDADYFHLYLNKADWFIRQGHLQQGLNYLTKAQYSSNSALNNFDKNFLYERLAKAYSSLDQPDSAYFYQAEAYAIRDSIYNENKRKEFIRFQAERYKKEFAEQASLAAQNAAQARQLLLTAALLGIIALILVFAYVQRRKSFNIISQQKETLHQQAVDDVIKASELKFLNASIEGGEMARDTISREIHDKLGSAMVTLSWQYDAVLDNFPTESPHYQQMEKLNTALKNLYQDIRHIAHQLGSGVLEKVGLVPVLEELCQDISADNKLDVDFSCYGMVERLSFFQEINILRIIQELVSNTLKYASATQLSVQINRLDNDLNIMVEDNGKGFDLKNIRGRGVGMSNVENRIRSLNGSIQVESQPATGTSVILNFPITPVEPTLLKDDQSH